MKKNNSPIICTVLITLGLFFYNSIQGQQYYGKLSLANVGAGMYVQLQAITTDSSFELKQRLLPGMKTPLFYTEGVKINGNIVRGRASVWGRFSFPFQGRLHGDSITMRMINSEGKPIGQLLLSTTKPADAPVYRDVAKQVLDTFKTYLFNKKYRDSADWKSFAQTVQQYGMFLQDDLEFVGAVNEATGKLPFSHCRFYKIGQADFMSRLEETFKGQTPVEYKRMPDNIAYLKIESFEGDGASITAALEKIIAAKSKNLIIDLRDNYGGGAGAALQLVKYLSPRYTPAGALVTNKWFDTTQRVPTAGDYNKFYWFSGGSTLQLIEAMKNNAGVVLTVEPAKKQFGGKVYVLTNSNTASTCEPLVYGLKSRGRATIIGERTAGAMLSAGGFWLSTGYVLSLPVADYFTHDGERLDGNGVVPHIKVESGEALNKALEEIGKSK